MALDRSMFSDKLTRYMGQLQVTAGDVVKDTGIPDERLSAILSQATEPTGDEILILADYFKCDYKFFISNEKLAPFETTESLFRKHGSELTRDDRWAIQEFLFLCECQDFLLSQLPQHARKPFIFRKTGTFYKTHGESAAQALRRHLDLAPNEIPSNVYAAFRTIGIHVFRRQLGQSTISGLFIRHPTAGPCVLVNYSEDIYRQRFTACHETGHAILDDESDFVVSFVKWQKGDLSEIRANTFASRFLLPPESLKSFSISWTEERFVDEAVHLMVNAQTLAFTLRELNLIDDQQSIFLSRLKVPINRKRDPELPESMALRTRQRKEDLLRRGLSDSYVNLCFEGYSQSIISAGRLAEMLLISETELAEVAALYGRPMSHGD